MRFEKDLNVAIKAIDVKFDNMSLEEKDGIFKKGLIDMIENVCDDAVGVVYEELTDWCIEYCNIKYNKTYPLNRFFKN